MTQPKVSVVIATWNRGRHILPTLRSVLAQTMQDFEIIVVGDGCTDDTEQVLQPYLSDRLRWFNLPRNTGSQAFPNNVGIANARGTFIAYLGHDDIWAKDHLSSLLDVFGSDDAVDFAIAGCVFHGPPDSNYNHINGMFENDEAKFSDFFPPSSIMLRQTTAKRVGDWQSSRLVKAPVDAEYSLRAAHMGCLFRSSQQITVHKFAAGHRYLYYLNQSAAEQDQMLKFLEKHDTREWRQNLIDNSKQLNRFMIAKHADYSAREPGELLERNAKNRGISLPPLSSLSGQVTIFQDDHPRALDWGIKGANLPFRWTGVNPRPKILIPYTSEDPVEFSMDVHGISDTTRANLRVNINGTAVDSKLVSGEGKLEKLEFSGALRSAEYSIVELYVPQGLLNGKMQGLALGNIRLSLL